MAKHNMTSLERKPNKEEKIQPFDENRPFFPLSLHVSTQEIEKLGLGDANVKDELVLIAKVRVTSVSISERDGGKKFEHMELTLIEGEVSKPKKDAAKLLFGKDDK